MSTDQTFEKNNICSFRDILEFRNNEIEYWGKLYHPVPGSGLVPEVWEAGPLVAFKMPGIDILAFNRVLFRNGPLPGDPGTLLDSIIQYYRSSGVPRFFLQMNDDIITPRLREAMAERGFEHYNDWTRLARPVTDFRDETAGTLTAMMIGREQAGLFSEIISGAFSFPEELGLHFSSCVGHPLFRHYLVQEKNRPLAAGALFIRGRYASLAIAGTLPEHRGKGAQGVLVRARIRQARDEGCRWITVETARETQDKKVSSYGNMLRFGFHNISHRQSHIYYT